MDELRLERINHESDELRKQVRVRAGRVVTLAADNAALLGGLLARAGAFTPQAVELDVRPYPALPDFVPAVGLPLLFDAWVRPPRPDGRADIVTGLEALDEPAAHQSDPVLLDLQLRALASRGGAGAGAARVRAIADAAHHPGDVAKWAASIRALHAGRPPPRALRAKPMPSTEQLMQAWPRAVDAAVRAQLLAPAVLPTDVPLADQARHACALLDVPVYANDLVPSLHALFSAYLSFAAASHFAAPAGEPPCEPTEPARAPEAAHADDELYA